MYFEARGKRFTLSFHGALAVYGSTGHEHVVDDAEDAFATDVAAITGLDAGVVED